jgi:glycosyltransferase involved in cell wall biosynthesis
MTSTAQDVDVRPDDGHRPELLVASVPASHVYIRHLTDPGSHAATVRRMDDPHPDDPSRAAQSRWWPPAMLDPSWIRAHPEFGVLHLQFGFDALAPSQLQAVMDAAHETGRPVVYTVHDLRNPHQVDRVVHDAQLDVLVPRADALLTLTHGAAQEIRHRWSRSATVVPHPHVVDLATMARLQRLRPERSDRPFTVGIHVKSLRACMDPHAVLPVLVEAVRQIPGAVLQVNGHRDVLEPSGARFDPELAVALAVAGDLVDVRVHDFLDDEALWDYLSSLDVSVLPYRFGTHSGWLEACRDLGTAVVAPTCGYYAEQGPVHSFDMGQDHFDAPSLVDAVLRAHAAGPAAAVSVADRVAQRRTIARAHEDVYRSVTAG